MKKINTPRSSGVYQGPAGSGSGNFQDTDPSGGTQVSAEWLQSVQEEICNVITRFGGTVGAHNHQMADALIDKILTNLKVSNTIWLKLPGGTTPTISPPFAFFEAPTYVLSSFNILESPDHLSTNEGWKNWAAGQCEFSETLDAGEERAIVVPTRRLGPNSLFFFSVCAEPQWFDVRSTWERRTPATPGATWQEPTLFIKSHHLSTATFDFKVNFWVVNPIDPPPDD